MTTPPSFSLVTEPWIRAQALDGADVLLSLREVFDGSQPVAAIRGETPTQDYAVLRVLLAIFWRAHRADAAVRAGETFDHDMWREHAWMLAQADAPDTAVLDYLDAHADRFDLVHPSTPFMQVADLHTTSGSRSSVERIIPEAESSYFSMRAGAGLASLSCPEAARWLIHTQAYDYSGIKSGAVGDPRVKGGKGYPIGPGWTGLTGGTTILGDTLLETLVLNTPLEALTAPGHDMPAWEREPDTAAERRSPVPTGPADIVTWQSRRIRLFTDGDRVTGVLVSNGDRVPDAGANIFDDPMTPYRFSTNKSTKAKDVFYPRPYETSRMMWRSLEPLLALDGDIPLARGVKAGKRPRTLDELAGLTPGVDTSLEVMNIRLTSASYGPQGSSASTTIDARIDIPRTLLHPESILARRAVLDTASATLAAARKLGVFAGRLLRAAGGEDAFQATHTDAVLAELEPDFQIWLARFDPLTAETTCRQWQDHVADRLRDRAQTLLRGAGPKALIGREVQDANGRTILLTAGTAYGQLLRDLRTSLPLLSPLPEKATSASDPADTPTQELTDAL